MKTTSENKKTLAVMAFVLAALFMFQGNSMAAGPITVTGVDGKVTYLNPGDVFDTPGVAEGEIQTFDEQTGDQFQTTEESGQPGQVEQQGTPNPDSEPTPPSTPEGSQFNPD